MPVYVLDPTRSTVTIDARSNVHPIHATSGGLAGSVETESVAGTVRLTGAHLSFPVDRLSSGNRLEDRELHRRIEARRFPTITGVMTSATIDGPGMYRVSGVVTFHGVEQQRQDVVTVEAVDRRTLRVTGGARFDVRDFGMEPPRILLLRVEPEVDVRIDLHATEEE